MKQINVLSPKRNLRIPLKNDVIPTLLLAFISRAAVMGMSPFAAAFFAAVYDKRIAYIGIAAALVGIAFSPLGAVQVPKYLIIFTAYWLFSRIIKKRSVAINSAAVGIAVLFGGGVMFFSGFGGFFDLFILITESATSALMYIIFKKAFGSAGDMHRRKIMSGEEYLCFTICVGAVLAGLSGIDVYGISLAYILTSYILLVTALNSDMSVSACTGLCIGFMSSMSTSGAVVVMGVYGFATLFASFMNSYRKIGCFAGYICAVSVMLIYAQTVYNLPQTLPNALIGGVLFLITPKTVHEYLRTFFSKSMQVETVNPSRRMREYLSMRIMRTAEAFASLHECFFSVTEGRLKKYSDDIGVILDEVAERVCDNCKMCGKCWQTEFRKTYKNMLELIAVIENEGKLSIDNIPNRFGEKCERATDFINEINHVYELYKRDVLRRSDAVTTRNLISMQYSEMNKLFAAMSCDIDEGFSFMEEEEEKIVTELDKIGVVPYEISAVESMSGACEVYLRLPHSVANPAVEGVLSEVLGRAVSYECTESGLMKYASGAVYEIEKATLQLSRDGYGVNGDSVAMFKTDSEKFYCIIADGMGSGGEAQYESAAVCRLLTSFLKAGFDVKTALGILNSSMCLNMDNEIYSTVDLLCVDLYTAEAQMYKIGSAQTVMLNGGDVKTVSSMSAPVGILSDIRLDKKSFSLKEGDVIIMMSDGITEAGCSVSKTEWIRKIIVKPFETVQDLAKEVMDTAIEKNNGKARDDMSVAVLRFMSK